MIVFKNLGTLDMRAITIFGLSSKNSHDKIGRFGTGLKYAIATILRNCGSIKILSDNNEYQFSCIPSQFRDQEFSQICMNGTLLPFTTALGKDWEMWMAFRELYSNAKDEGGEIIQAFDSAEGNLGETLIEVNSDSFDAIYDTIEEHFIDDEQSIWANSKLEIYKGKSKFIFYKGIAVYELKEPSAFRYNILSYLDLTEDRTVKYYWSIHSILINNLPLVDNESVINQILNRDLKFEGSIDFTSFYGTPSNAFIACVKKQGVKCNYSMINLVNMHTAQFDPDSVNIITPLSPGGKCFIESVRKLSALKESTNDIVWILDPQIVLTTLYHIKNEAVVLCSSIFDDQEKMDEAVFSAFADLQKDEWKIKKLIALAEIFMENTK